MAFSFGDGSQGEFVFFHPGQFADVDSLFSDAVGKRLGEVELRAWVGAGLFKQPLL